MDGKLSPLHRLSAGALALAFLTCAAARADDYGPRRDVAAVRTAAKRLLAHRLRSGRIDPASAVLSDAVVSKDEALVSWSAGKTHGLLGLRRSLDRWWDVCGQASGALPLFTPQFTALALQHNSAMHAASGSAALNRPCTQRFPDLSRADAIESSGGTLPAQSASAYAFLLTYGANDAPSGAHIASLRVRAPSGGEILGDPPPPRDQGGPTDVALFYLNIASSRPIVFQPPSGVDVWVPWMLDDSSSYELVMFSGHSEVGPVKGTLFDNVLHFELPGFTATPGELRGEIDAVW
ncbi:MAG: hypothetical protein ABR508_02685 [Candidatus Baltobacteraceae bacterium]